MGRKRQYASAAERLRAFRARAQGGHADPEQAQVTPSASFRKRASRPARLQILENETHALLEEYQSWQDRLPESLQESRLAAKLEEALDKFREMAELLASIDLPKGFGRD